MEYVKGFVATVLFGCYGGCHCNQKVKTVNLSIGLKIALAQQVVHRH